MVYRPPFIKQLDGSTYGGYNCTLASMCMAVVRHYRGVNPPGTALWYPRPSDMRYKSGDRSGGTTLAQASALASKYYGASMSVRYSYAWSEFIKRIVEGRGAILQGSYSVLAPTAYDACPGFTGNHAVYVNERRYNSADHRYELLVYDPLADGRRAGIWKGPRWIPESLMKTFAGKLWLGSRTVGYGYCYTMYTRDTESDTQAPAQIETVLKYGGVPYGPRIMYARVAGARVRVAPTTASGTGTILRSLPLNGEFAAYQRTSQGQMVYGSSVWYGSRRGGEWVHTSVLKLSK
jgi:hypothetical protein